MRKRLRIERDLYTILQILSGYPFEKVPLFQPLTATHDLTSDNCLRNQLSLFDL